MNMSWTLKIRDAAQGRRRWKHMRKALPAERYLFFPEDDKEITHWGIQLLPEYIRLNAYNHVIAFCKGKETCEKLQELSLHGLEAFVLSEIEMEEFANYYALVNQSSRWTFVSVTCPYDTGAVNMAGRKGFTKKDIVIYDIYKLA